MSGNVGYIIQIAGGDDFGFGGFGLNGKVGGYEAA